MRDSFNDLTFSEMLIKRQELQKQYSDLRFDFVVGHVDNRLLKRTLRRQIARLNTRIYNHADVDIGTSVQADQE